MPANITRARKLTGTGAIPFPSSSSRGSQIPYVDRTVFLGRNLTDIGTFNRIKKPKTHRYPSLNGTDPKFRRNHRHALHGTMRALVFSMDLRRTERQANSLNRKRSRREKEKPHEREEAEECFVAELGQ